ncbi:MAG: hypothetical protein HZC41_26160 [Chloroflexi bacterium]|nr:hypothetical protein [Chloroflexota bacterium]
MSDLYQRISGERGSLERLLMRLPGFEGYLDQKARRSADRMVRDYIAARLDERIDRLAEIERKLLDSGGLSYMSKTNAVKTRMQLYRDRVKTAAPGYSGFFADVEVGPEQLETIYMFDELQIKYADQFQTALAALEQAVTNNAGIDEALAAVDRVTAEANEAFAKRDDLLTGLGSSL